MKVMLLSLMLLLPFLPQVAHASEQIIGVGITFAKTESGYVVYAIVPGSPAAEDGTVKKDDQIAAVTDASGVWQSVAGLTLNQVVELIRGPEATPVGLHFIRPPGEYSVTLMRRKITP